MNIKASLSAVLLSLAALPAAEAGLRVELVDSQTRSYGQTISTTSTDLCFRLVDDAVWTEVSTPSAVTVSLVAADRNWNPSDSVASSVLVSTDGFASSVPLTSTPVFQIGAGSTNGCADTRFRVRVSTTVTGQVGLKAFSSTVNGWGYYGGAFFTLDVLGPSAVFSGLSVRNGTDAPSTNALMTPDRDGVRDYVRVLGTAPANGPWQVEVSTAVGGEILRTLYGYGQTMDAYWYGEDHQNRTLPNGTYVLTAKFAGGSIRDASLSATLNSAFLTGVVRSTPSMSFLEANVNVFGPGGGGSGASNAGDGVFTVWGLRAGQSYGVNAEKPGYVGAQMNNVLVLATGTNVGTLALEPGVLFHVSAVRELAAGAGNDFDAWANLHARTTDYARQSHGHLHFPAETALADDGNYWATPASYTVLSVPPNRQIVVTLDIYNYGRFTQTHTSPAAGQPPLSILFASTQVVRQPVVGGTITLSSASVNGNWVSVDGMKAGETRPTVYGGVYISSGQTTGAYQILGVSTGTWTFRTFSQGLKSTSTAAIAVTTDTVVNFTIDQGGKATGTITLTGSFAGVTAAQLGGPGGSCAPGSIPVSLNAWSPSSFTNSWTAVCVSTASSPASSTYTLTGLDDGVYDVHTYLPSFELTPPGRRTLTVSGGAGSLNITYARLDGTLVLRAQHDGSYNATDFGYQVQSEWGGPDQTSAEGLFSVASGTATAVETIQGLGTGLYRVMVKNMLTGLVKPAAAAVVNGTTATVTLVMTDPVYTASGTVGLSGSLVLPSTWSVTVSSVAGLAAAIGAPPVIEVFSFPLPRSFHGNVMPFASTAVVPVAGANTGTFTITGLVPGSYLARVRNDLNPPACPGPNCGMPGAPEFGTSNTVFHISTLSVSGVDLTLTNGVGLSGTISTGGTDPETGLILEVYLRKADNLTTYRATATISGGTSADYGFQHLADGDYTLEIREGTSPGQPAKYVAAPVKVTIAGAAVDQDVTLESAGVIVGRLRDQDSDTLITSQNAGSLLGNGFYVRAEANPRVPGGWGEMIRCDGMCDGSVYISSVTGQFTVHRLRPGLIYDVNVRGSDSFDPSAIAQGQKAYTPVQISGIKVEAGRTVDLGVVSLSQGVTLSGTVTDASSAPLANIPVSAYPAQLDGGDRHDLAVQGFTDKDGNYDLVGIDRNIRYYNVVAAPRFESGGVGNLLSGPRYGQETKRNVDTQDAAQRSGVDFVLTQANGVLTGSVRTADGGPLTQPFGGGGGDEGYREASAAVMLQLDGAVSDADNPMGDIEEKTDPHGNFTVSGLKPGTYTMRIVSVGYVTDKRTVVVNAGSNSAGTITLQTGAQLSGSITRPDGSYPTTGEMRMVVAIDRNFDEFAFASMEADAGTGQVTGYTLDGFKPGVSYSIVAVPDDDSSITELASGVTFTSSTETKTLNLVFKPAAPTVYVNQSRSGNTYTLKFFSTQKLRNLTDADSDLTQIVTCATCAGAINYASSTITGSRNTIEVVYDATPAETSFALRLQFTTAVQDLESAAGANFTYDQTFTFYAGVGKSRIVRISNTMGGDCSLEGSAAGSAFDPGAFDVSASSGVNVGIQSATDVSVLSAAFAASAAPLTARLRAVSTGDAAARLGRAAYPSQRLFRAAAAAPTVSPFSSFYDVFLPAGVSHTLKKDALITLKYDDAVTDPSSLNVYYFDPNNGVYLLEDADRVVDAVNKTITVAVRHLSTFVVLNGNAQVVGAANYAGGEVQAFNVPNPFNLKSKTVSLSQASGETITTDGTVIRYALPAGVSGSVKIEIFDASGALVREISQSAPSGGSYYYTEWDGRNDAGKKVASGVYMARLSVNGGNETFFKMAVIK